MANDNPDDPSSLKVSRDALRDRMRSNRSRISNALAVVSDDSDMKMVAAMAMSHLAEMEDRLDSDNLSMSDLRSANQLMAAIQNVVTVLETAAAGTGRGAGGPVVPKNPTIALVHQMTDDLFEKKILDPYLRFDSASEEEEYRKRAAERKAEIDRLKKIGTPEAYWQANELIGEQLKDAKQYGAEASPDFDRLVQYQQNTKAKLKLGEEPPIPAQSDQIGAVAALLKEAGVTPAPEEQPAMPISLALAQAQSISRGNQV